VSVAHRTYARALFDAAKERNRLERAREELGDFVDAARDLPELRALLLSPQLDPRAKIAALDEVLGGGEELVRNFILTLVEKGRGGEIEEIHREFERLVAREAGQLNVELTTAFELSEEDAEAIVRQIEEASGRKVEATREVDPSLIGGLVLQAGSLRVDASVRGRLERLRQELVGRTA
jgi:F-type H+-transporting ATPase subunit delta